MNKDIEIVLPKPNISFEPKDILINCTYEEYYKGNPYLGMRDIICILDKQYNYVSPQDNRVKDMHIIFKNVNYTDENIKISANCTSLNYTNYTDYSVYYVLTIYGYILLGTKIDLME